MTRHERRPGPLGARWLAARAWLYGYPALVMDRSRQLFTGGPDVGVNQLAHLQVLPDHTFRAVVRPNQDTLYSSAMLDLSGGPRVLRIPHVPERRFVMFCLLDAWTNAFTARGSRSSTSGEGCDAQTLVLLGPNAAVPSGLPTGAEIVRCPTNGVWLLGRVEVAGREDLPRARAIQAEVVLETLAGGGPAAVVARPSTEPGEAGGQPGAEVLALEAEPFFRTLSRLLAEQPPPETDAPMLRSLSALGLEPGQMAIRDRRAMEHGARLGRRLLRAAKAAAGARPGWGPGPGVPLGDYGDRYLVRALVALVGFGANRREDAVYLNAARDRFGRRLDGARGRYRLRFEAGGTPPVRAFWSVSLYDRDGFFVANPIARHVLGSHDDLPREADGALELLVQRDPPEDRRRWLPAPDGPFELTLRMYWPEDSLIAGRWTPPTIRREPV